MNSVFHLIVQKCVKNSKTPWKTGPTKQVHGSAFGVKIAENNETRNKIITNAHCVEDAISVRCSYHGGFIHINVDDICQELDLAILSVPQESYTKFWESIDILNFGTILSGDSVQVIGFPSGGRNPSITKGIVSRIVQIDYTQIDKNVAYQIDAAINPGNSGGPVIHKNRIVGVAFCRSKMENMCYMIPVQLLQYYISAYIRYQISKPKISKPLSIEIDYQKSKPQNSIEFCDLGITVCNSENSDLKEYILGTQMNHGVLITHVDELSSSNGILQVNDFLIEIDGIEIQNDMTIKSNIFNANISYEYIIKTKYPGDVVNVKFIRDRQIHNNSIKLIQRKQHPIPVLKKHITSDYYNCGGLVFIPLNLQYVIDTDSDIMNKLKLYSKTLSDIGSKQVIILSSIINTPLTTGYDSIDIVLESVNDILIDNITDLKTICEKTSDEFLVFKFESKEVMVLGKKEALEISKNLNYLFDKIEKV